MEYELRKFSNLSNLASLYESSLSFFLGEWNTNAIFSGSARCTENPLFLRNFALY